MNGSRIQEIIVAIAVLVVSISLHEFGHALAADRLGDPGPRRDGRLTLWPDKHFEPVGFIFMLVTVIAGFGLGWGKPVQVNPRNFRNPRSGMLLTALAGPFMNLLLALAAGLTLRLCFAARLSAWFLNADGQTWNAVGLFVITFLTINLALIFFNLIPIHPLDGSKVVSALLPAHQAARYDATVGMYGPIFLLLIFAFGNQILSPVLTPAIQQAQQLIVGPLV